MLRYLSLLAVCACAVPPDGAPTLMGKMSSNGLVLRADLLRDLSASPLAGSPAAAQLATTDDGLELLRYAVTCALPEGDTLSIAGHDLPGTLGLAPAWADAPLDASGRRWISACLLAHANATGVHVPIWLRADNDALGAEPGGDFTYQEAAFYGDVFASPPAMYACVGRGLIENAPPGVSIIDDADEYLHHRLCSLGDGACGIVSTGLCATYPQAPGACDHDAGELGAFDACHAETLTRDGDPASAPYQQVITVYLQP